MHSHVFGCHKDDLLTFLRPIGAIPGAQIDVHTSGQTVRAVSRRDHMPITNQSTATPSCAACYVQHESHLVRKLISACRLALGYATCGRIMAMSHWQFGINVYRFEGLPVHGCGADYDG